MKLFKKIIKRIFKPNKWTETESTDNYRIKEMREGFLVENKQSVWKFTKYPFLKVEQNYYLDWVVFSGFYETKELAEQELERIKLLPKYYY